MVMTYLEKVEDVMPMMTGTCNFLGTFLNVGDNPVST